MNADVEPPTGPGSVPDPGAVPDPGHRTSRERGAAGRDPGAPARPAGLPGLEIRPMRDDDAGQVLAIYQAGLDGGQASFETTAPSWERFVSGRLAHPRQVAVITGPLAEAGPAAEAGPLAGAAPRAEAGPLAGAAPRAGTGVRADAEARTGTSARAGGGADPAPGEVVGWVAASPVSARPVYAGVVEHSLYVRPGLQGRGVGRALLAAFITASEEAGIWTIQGGIFPENAPSISLHLALGFRVVGVRERVGRHHGVWRDVVLLERRSTVAGT